MLEDIDLAPVGGQPRDLGCGTLAVAHVEDERKRLHALLAQRVADGAHTRLVSSCEYQPHTLAAETPGTGLAYAARGAGDKCDFFHDIVIG